MFCEGLVQMQPETNGMPAWWMSEGNHWYMYIKTWKVPLQLTSPSSPSRRHLSVSSALSPVSVWSLQCRLGRRRVCRKINIRVVFKSGWTLRSMLTKVKDTLPPGKQSNVVYRIPCSCGQVYIGETKRRLETRLPRCLWEGDDGEVSCSGTCMGAPPPDPLGDHHTGQWQRTGVVGEGGLTQLCRWHLWKSVSTEMEDWKSLVAGPLWWGGRGEEQSSPTFDLQWRVSSVVHGYK